MTGATAAITALPACPCGTKATGWEHFVRTSEGCHLVTGEHAADRLSRAKLLARLIVALRPKREWAIGLGCDRGRRLVQAAFEEEGDARRLARVLGGRPVRRYVGWATQREFEFTPGVADRLRKALMLT